MKQENIEKLSSAKVGDKVETKNWVYTVHLDESKDLECNDCCFLEWRGHPSCLAKETTDGLPHYFTRERKGSKK